MAARRWGGEEAGGRGRAAGAGEQARKQAARKAKPAPDLMQVALSKLDQRDRTKEQLRKLLLKKAMEARADAAGDDDDGRASARPTAADEERVGEVLARLEGSGLLNDRRFAEHFARSARSRGASAAKVQQKLGQRGIAKTGVEEALTTLADEGLDDLAAAQQYAKRRRLRERYDLTDPKERQKALAGLARQGFSIGTALRALEASDTGDD